MSEKSTPNLSLEIAHVLFMDIVGYSKLRVDEQHALIQEMNEVVLSSEQFRSGETNGQLIRLPTGDGMALVFLNKVEAPVQCAAEISRALKDHPRLQLRMGIHSGPVSQVNDVNQRSNVAGAGINIAQRVMDCGDAGHILLSKHVAEDLEHYRHWEPFLHELGGCEVKHGTKVSVVNLYNEEVGNSALPEKFKRAAEADLWRSVRHRTGRVLVWLTIVVTVLALSRLITRRFAPERKRAAEAQIAETQSSDNSIAVLPFIDMSQTHDQEYFCDGISEEILGELAKVVGLRVVARTSSFSFKGKTMDVGEIARRLGVQNILEGSLRREGNRIRVTAQLINARDGFHLWAETYERELQGVFAMQDEITHAITDALKLKLIGARAIAEKPQDTEAHELYLQGVYFSNKSTEEDLRKSLDFFRRSLEKEPHSARTWTGIAKVWYWLADAYVKPLEAYPASKAAALKALELDDGEAEAHVYLAEGKRVLDWDVTGGEAELRRALQFDPNSGSAHLFLALNLGTQGKSTESGAEMRAALKADPLSPFVSNFAGICALVNGEVDEAIEQGKRIIKLDPGYLYQFPILAYAYMQKGMFPEAIEIFKKAQETIGLPQAGLATAYAKTGRQAEARQILEELKKIAATRYYPADEIASIYVALDEKDAAFTWLERSYDEHSAALHAIAHRWAFLPLRSDPRFSALLKRIGLDPAKVIVPPTR